MTRASNVVIGQKVAAAKIERARELRQRMTHEEALLWKRLRGNRTGFHFRRQQVIDGFIVDFYCHSAGVVVEVDGPIHQTQFDSDRERDQVLTARGLRVLRVRNDEVTTHLDAVVKRIVTTCNG